MWRKSAAVFISCSGPLVAVNVAVLIAILWIVVSCCVVHRHLLSLEVHGLLGVGCGVCRVVGCIWCLIRIEKGVYIRSSVGGLHRVESETAGSAKQTGELERISRW